MTQADGWYPDPAGKADTFRWWDGTAWTRFLSADRASLAPSQPEPPPETAWDESTQADADPPVREDQVHDEQVHEDQVHEEPRVRLAVAVGTVVAVLLVAIVAVGAVVTASTHDLPEGPAAAPAAPPSAAVDFDAGTLEAQVAGVRATMPAKPYSCQAQQALPPTFSDAAICDTVVFTDYHGAEDWYAGLGFGVISTDLESEDDLKTTTRNVFDSLQRQFYADEDTTATKFLYQELPDIPTTRAVALAGELHYEIDGLTPRFDRVLLIVVKLRTGEHVAWFSARPDGTPESTLDSLNASLNSVTIRG